MPGEGNGGYTGRANLPYGDHFHKGKARKGKLFNSSLTWDFGKTKGKGNKKNPGAHRINGDNMLMPKGYEKIGKPVKNAGVPKLISHEPHPGRKDKH